MKTRILSHIVAVPLLLALAPMGHAKLAVIAAEPAATAPDEIAGEPAAATRERDYFQAPTASIGTHNFPCRLHVDLFEKMRLAQACR